MFPGFKSRGVVEQVSDGGLEVRVRKTSEPCKDSLIVVSLVAVENVTRIRVEQAEVPAWVLQAIDIFVLGGDQIFADFMLFIERGVQQCRHSLPWAFPGLVVAEVATELEVVDVMPGMWASRVGLSSGDLLLTVGGAPVFTQHCLLALMWVLPAGAETAATWVRDDKLLEGVAGL